ncbi:MAG: c-type cytochrome [Gammaproteobacteria bacterium]|jgi:cytochrome c553|nr:c-type cytochrome [Gammaproteobacteria bacterium]
MRLNWILLPLALSVAAMGALAEDDPQRGGEIYTTCAACHGAQAEGNRSLNAPRLTHLAPVYIVAQLQKFKAGARGGSGASESARQMAAIAATLADDQAMYDTAAYIATLKGGVSVATVEADPELGASYYRQFCAACHGPAAEGNPALNSPRLAGADDWYLLAQLQAFRGGSRGSHPQDRTGKQMRAMAGVLPDDAAVAAVVSYIHGLGQ